jgi:hypothetical protein
MLYRPPFMCPGIAVCIKGMYRNGNGLRNVGALVAPIACGYSVDVTSMRGVN